MISALVVGCGRIGYDERSGRGPDGGDGDGDSDSEDAGSPNDCIVSQLTVGSKDAVLQRRASELTDRVSSSCAPAGSRELAIEITATKTGLYSLRALSQQESVYLALLDGSDCTASELTCEQASVMANLTSGQTAVVVVEAPDVQADDVISFTASFIF